MDASTSRNAPSLATSHRDGYNLDLQNNCLIITRSPGIDTSEMNQVRIDITPNERGGSGDLGVFSMTTNPSSGTLLANRGDDILTMTFHHNTLLIAANHPITRDGGNEIAIDLTTLERGQLDLSNLIDENPPTNVNEEEARLPDISFHDAQGNLISKEEFDRLSELELAREAAVQT